MIDEHEVGITEPAVAGNDSQISTEFMDQSDPESSINIIELTVGLIVFVAFVTLSPIPYYQAYELPCNPTAMCPKKGWHTAPALAVSLVSWARTKQKPGTMTPTPTPEANTQQNVPNGTLYTVAGMPYQFRYPQEVQVTQAGDVTALKTGTAALMYRYVDKVGSIDNLMNNYFVFGVPAPIRFGPRETVTAGILKGYKTKTDNGEITYYFLGRSGASGIMVFYYFNGDQAAEQLLQTILPSVTKP